MVYKKDIEALAGLDPEYIRRQGEAIVHEGSKDPIDLGYVMEKVNKIISFVEDVQRDVVARPKFVAPKTVEYKIGEGVPRGRRAKMPIFTKGTRIVINGKPFTISSQYITPVKGIPDSGDTIEHNQFDITVCSREKGCQTFKYYGSNQDYLDGKTELSRGDLLFVFRCIADDAIAGLMSFGDFRSKFGYNKESLRDEFEKTAKKLGDLGLTETDLYDTRDMM